MCEAAMRCQMINNIVLVGHHLPLILKFVLV